MEYKNVDWIIQVYNRWEKVKVHLQHKFTKRRFDLLLYFQHKPTLAMTNDNASINLASDLRHRNLKQFTTPM